MGKSKTAVYAGTFDPITNGHLDIIERTSTVFDDVVVAIAEQSGKQALFSVEERKSLIQGAIKSTPGSVRVDSFKGLLVDYVKSIESHVIVRGLRAVSDYEYEAQMAIINRQLSRDIETVYFVTSQRCSFISSSIVKELARFGGDISGMVPANVGLRLAEVFKEKR